MAFCHHPGVWMYVCEWYSPVCVWVGSIFVVLVCLYSTLGMCECVCCWWLHECVHLIFLFVHLSNLLSSVCACTRVCQCMCLCVCVQPHFLWACWSILAFGEKDAVRSPRLLCFQHWIRDRAMICGNDFINATNLSFPPSLPFSLSFSLSLSVYPPSWVGESALLCALNER